MQGTVAVTDLGWYECLAQHPELDEINFWKPSSTRSFQAPEFSPFFFKLKAPHYPFHGQQLRVPVDPRFRPSSDFLEYHREQVFLG